MILFERHSNEAVWLIEPEQRWVCEADAITNIWVKVRKSYHLLFMSIKTRMIVLMLFSHLGATASQLHAFVSTISMGNASTYHPVYIYIQDMILQRLTHTHGSNKNVSYWPDLEEQLLRYDQNLHVAQKTSVQHISRVTSQLVLQLTDLAGRWPLLTHSVLWGLLTRAEVLMETQTKKVLVSFPLLCLIWMRCFYI